MENKKLCFNLHIFDGAGDGGAQAANNGESALQHPTNEGSEAVWLKQNAGKTAAEQNDERNTIPNGRGSKVVYGKQAGTDDNNIPTNHQENSNPKDRKAMFEELIKGEYKNEFTERTNNIVKERFKEMKNLEKFKGDVSPLIDVLGQRYGIEDGNIQSILKAIDEDNYYWEMLADEWGLSVEQCKTKVKMESENRKLKEAMAEHQRQEKIQQQYRQWEAEALDMKADYPDFDLKTEALNKNFIDLLSRGIEMRTAYEVTHLSDIKNKVAQTTQNAVTKTIQATGQRPSENGVSAQSGLVVKSNVKQLTKADRAEIARRVQRGEQIMF